MDLTPDDATRYAFFTGKGGVGKTTLASGFAMALADAGRRVLLVSTDPASNLDDVLGIALTGQAAPVPGVMGLEALNIDPEEAVKAYRARALAPYKGIMPEDALRGMEEQMSGACTVEIAAFDEFTDLLTNDSKVGGRFDHIVFDTAPTGHTLRLLALPAAWTNFLETNEAGASCLGPTSALKSQQARYQQAVAALGDGSQTTIYLVARPDHGSLAEAARTAGELRSLGVANQRLLLNGILRSPDSGDAVAERMKSRQAAALEAMPVALRGLQRKDFPLSGRNMMGVPTLRSIFKGNGIIEEAAGESAREIGALPPPLSQLVDELAAHGHGLVMLMGKGGVGKTTMAAAVAVELASRGQSVHLSTTDPAAHLSEVLGREVDGLRVSRIDPVVETEKYQRQVLERAGAGLDAAGRDLLAEDLKSPCTEEVAVFHAFSHLINEARNGFVVIDTAPTGHTLLLLDATGAYHKEVLRTMNKEAGRITTPMMRLRDPDYTRVVIVTLAEPTPVLEAGRLQEDLRRAGIEPYAWVINNSLAATGTSDPILRLRAAAESEHINKIAHELAQRAFIAPWSVEDPHGPESLKELVRGVAGASA